MGITSIDRKPGSRKSEINALWQRTYEVQFVIETDSKNVGPIAVRTAVGMTGTWYTNGLLTTDPNYEYDHGSFVQSIDVAEDGDSGVQWTATVKYGPYDTSQFGSDPTSWLIKVSFGGDRLDKVVQFDQAGNPIRNSAGDPFDPPVTIDDSRVTMTVTRNELVSYNPTTGAGFNPATPFTFNDTTNSAIWNGFAIGTVKLGIITTSEPQYDSNAHVYYYTVTYPFTFNRAGWIKNLLDCGCNQLDSSSPPRPIPITNNGQPITEPVNLDGSGHRLVSTGTPVTLPTNVYNAVDWSSLGINLSLRLGA